MSHLMPQIPGLSALTGISGSGSSPPPGNGGIQMEWLTTRISAGSSNTVQVKLPLVSDGSYDFVINWGDGSNTAINTWDDANTTHTYANTGTYNTIISGVCEGWRFADAGDKNKLIKINNWDTLKFTNVNSCFQGCAFLEEIAATDAPNTANLTTLEDFFDGCGGLITANFSGWDTSGVTTLAGMFRTCVNLTDLNGMEAWDVRLVTDMTDTWQSCTLLENADVSSWNTNALTAVTFAWSAVHNWNPDLTNWNMGKISIFTNCLWNARKFDRDISGWNTASATKMSNMFDGCYLFNSNLDNWDVVTVSKFDNMFKDCNTFNGTMSNWTTTAASNVISMFQDCVAFDQDVSSFDFVGTFAVQNFMLGCELSTANYDAMLINLSGQNLSNGLTIHFGTSKYSAGAATTARDLIISSDGWTILDGGQV